MAKDAGEKSFGVVTFQCVGISVTYPSSYNLRRRRERKRERERDREKERETERERVGGRERGGEGERASKRG